MALLRFKLQDSLLGWVFNSTQFDDFNLLVGKSGVGKTQILNAIRRVRWAGIVATDRVSGCDWEMDINVGGDIYNWKATTSLVKEAQVDEEGVYSASESPKFIREVIVKNNVEILIDRSEESFIFSGNDLPKLSNTESGISLLKNENLITPLHDSLSRILFSFVSKEQASLWRSLPVFDFEYVKRLRSSFSTLLSLRENLGASLLARAYILQEDYPAEFEQVVQAFTEIFTTVSDIKIGSLAELKPEMRTSGAFTFEFTLGIKEKGVNEWILVSQMSSGMLRTLIHLIEIALAPAGVTFLIDEFENSLGVNCLPQLTEYLLRRSDLQFIITSHHPYVINNIPWKYWKLVTRKGAIVSIKDASSIPALSSASSLEKFTQLMNLEEYEEAIQ